MRLLVPVFGLILLGGCINPTCQHLQNAATTNANACGAMAPTEAALQQCDQGIDQCSASDTTALDAFATCLSEISGCGQMSTDNNPDDSPVAVCSQKVANISSQCGGAISLPSDADAGD